MVWFSGPDVYLVRIERVGFFYPACLIENAGVHCWGGGGIVAGTQRPQSLVPHLLRLSEHMAAS